MHTSNLRKHGGQQHLHAMPCALALSQVLCLTPAPGHPAPTGAVTRTLDGRVQHIEDGQLQHEVRLAGQSRAGPLLLLPSGKTLLVGTSSGSVVALPWASGFPATAEQAAAAGLAQQPSTARQKEQRLHCAALTHMRLCPLTNMVLTARWATAPAGAAVRAHLCAAAMLLV